MYEKRKAAALEIEKMVKDFVSVGNTSQIKKLLKVPEKMQIKYFYKYKREYMLEELSIVLFLHRNWTLDCDVGTWKRVCHQSKSSHAQRRVDRCVFDEVICVKTNATKLQDWLPWQLVLGKRQATTLLSLSTPSSPVSQVGWGVTSYFKYSQLPSQMQTAEFDIMPVSLSIMWSRYFLCF